LSTFTKILSVTTAACAVGVFLLAAAAIKAGANGLFIRPPSGGTAFVPDASEKMALAKNWFVAGACQGAACDPATGEIYAMTFGGDITRFDRAGKQLERIHLDLQENDHPTTLRLANLIGDQRPEFIVFSVWGPSVHAFDTAGKTLWNYPTGDGVDDVWPATVLRNPDTGLVPVVIGYNGMGGVHLINSDGSVRWKNPSVANVWHVCAERTGINGEAQIVTTSAGGRVHFFSLAGKEDRVLPAGTYSHMVRVSRPEPESKPVVITADSASNQIVAMTAAGDVLWRSPVPIGTTGHLHDGACAEGRPWFAALLDGGIVAVYDVTTGARLASGDLKASQITWTRGTKDTPPLLITGGSSLRAFELQARKPMTKDDQKDVP
jgi:outer membrane protein assembly factor BamB